MGEMCPSRGEYLKPLAGAQKFFLTRTLLSVE